MSKRILWKKGMRLTPEVLTASDQCKEDFIGRSLLSGTMGRFGLLPVPTPFELTVTPGDTMLEIESLSCVGVTKSGQLIDVSIDTRYNPGAESRVALPSTTEKASYLLTINRKDKEWREVNDGYAEPVYTFALLSPDSPMPDNALPIGRMVRDEMGWHLDEEDFVPPCLSIHSHHRYSEQYHRFIQLLREMESKAFHLRESGAKKAMHHFWPQLQQLLIETDMERDTATPLQLLSRIARMVSAFSCACELDDYIGLTDAHTFRAYALAPYNLQNTYRRIKEGMQLCVSILEKLDKMKEEPQQTPPPTPPPSSIAPPMIPEQDRRIGCANKAKVHVSCAEPGATVYFSLDGSEPRQPMQGGIIMLNTGFTRERVKEPEKTFMLKLMARKGSASSQTVAYKIVLYKDFNIFDGPTI